MIQQVKIQTDTLGIAFASANALACSGVARRFIAVLAILALAVTILPGIPNLASAVPDCCKGMMCPMHQAHGSSCDMGSNGSGCALKCLPGQLVGHYTATIVFVLFAPMTLQRIAESEPALAFLPHLSPDAFSRVDSPPPRLPLSA